MGVIILTAIILVILSYSIAPTLYFKVKGTEVNSRNEEDKFLTLTFDDGPDPKYTVKLLDLLKKYNIKATFFVVAKFAEENPNIIGRMESEGHTIGLHSLEHKNGLLKGIRYTNNDFKESKEIMNKLNIKVKTFRPPWGHLNLATLINLKKYNYKLVLWNVIIGDWKGNITYHEISRRLLKETKNKDIICLHDGRGENEAPLRTIEALEITLPIWIKEGYKFLTVGELYE